MSRPRWRLVRDGREPLAYTLARIAREYQRSQQVISVGPGSRIEYIGPHCQYNWAEGSRYIEARNGASLSRSKAWSLIEWRRVNLLIQLQFISNMTALADLG